MTYYYGSGAPAPIINTRTGNYNYGYGNHRSGGAHQGYPARQQPARTYQSRPTGRQQAPAKPAYSKQGELQTLYKNRQTAINTGNTKWLTVINNRINTLKHGNKQQPTKPTGYGKQQPARATQAYGGQSAPKPTAKQPYPKVTNMQTCRDALQIAHQNGDKGAIARYTKQMQRYRGTQQPAAPTQDKPTANNQSAFVTMADGKRINVPHGGIVSGKLPNGHNAFLVGHNGIPNALSINSNGDTSITVGNKTYKGKNCPNATVGDKGTQFSGAGCSITIQ